MLILTRALLIKMAQGGLLSRSVRISSTRQDLAVAHVQPSARLTLADLGKCPSTVRRGGVH